MVSKTGKRQGPREALLPGTLRGSSINRKVCTEGQPCWLPRRNHTLLKTKHCMGGRGWGCRELYWETAHVCAGHYARKQGRRAPSSGTPTSPSLNCLLSLASLPKAQSLPPTEPAATMGMSMCVHKCMRPLPPPLRRSKCPYP